MTEHFFEVHSSAGHGNNRDGEEALFFACRYIYNIFLDWNLT